MFGLGGAQLWGHTGTTPLTDVVSTCTAAFDGSALGLDLVALVADASGCQEPSQGVPIGATPDRKCGISFGLQHLRSGVELHDTHQSLGLGGLDVRLGVRDTGPSIEYKSILKLT